MKKWLKRLLNGSRNGRSSFLHPEEQLREILRRERARADRAGTILCLLTFHLPRPAQTRDDLSALVEVLAGRLRTTDEAGLLSRESVGVVLPDTPPAGGVKVADDVCRLARRGGFYLHWEISVYPVHDSHETTLSPGTEAERDVPAGTIHSMNALFVQPMPASKRWLDVVGAVFGLLLLSPLLLSIAVAIRLTSPGPVLFRQTRAGLAGTPFRMFKFRSMVDKADEQQEELRSFSEQDGPAFKLAADPRVTSLGWFLRRTSFDELPQLWNVLRGEMSLVGPRPLPCDETEGCQRWQKCRLDVTPGLTCLWQVRGRSRVSFDDWMRMDSQYVRSRSFLSDLVILFQTVPAVLLRRGAY